MALSLPPYRRNQDEIDISDLLRALDVVTEERDRLRAQTTWQPIETAKEYAGLMFLYRPGLPLRDRIAIRRPEDWCGEKCCPSAKPTHWQPLPPAPVERREE